MKAWARAWQVVGGLVAAVVAVSAITLAIRQASWGPVTSVAWLPAVLVATWPGTYRPGRCLPGRNRQAR